MTTNSLSFPHYKPLSSFETPKEARSVQELIEVSITEENLQCLKREWAQALEKLDETGLAEVEIPQGVEEELVSAWKNLMGERLSFRLSSSYFSTSSVKAFSEMLKANEYLESLFLCDQTIDDEDLIVLSEGIAENMSLRELHFHNNSLGDAGVKALVEALKKNLRIAKVGLRHNEITSISARAFTECFDANKIKLQESSSGSLQLIIAISNLSSLDLSHNQITEDGAIALARALSDQKVEEKTKKVPALMPPKPLSAPPFPPALGGAGPLGGFGGSAAGAMGGGGPFGAPGLGAPFPPMSSPLAEVPENTPASSGNPSLLGVKKSLNELDLRHNPIDELGILACLHAKTALEQVELKLPNDPDDGCWVSEQGGLGEFNLYDQVREREVQECWEDESDDDL